VLLLLLLLLLLVVVVVVVVVVVCRVCQVRWWLGGRGVKKCEHTRFLPGPPHIQSPTSKGSIPRSASAARAAAASNAPPSSLWKG
jgi:hypothetical protein